jgi:hypothetical protein
MVPEAAVGESAKRDCSGVGTVLHFVFQDARVRTWPECWTYDLPLKARFAYMEVEQLSKTIGLQPLELATGARYAYYDA